MDFRIVIDTREQAEYSFACESVRRKLDAGDYSVDGLEEHVAVERKSLADFTRTVIHDFQRFATELDQLSQMTHACIVVEADLAEHAGSWLVQEMVPGGIEVVVGVSHDPSFGPLVMVGMGGTLVELHKDVAVRITPLTDTDIDEMLGGTAGTIVSTEFEGITYR